MIPDFLTIYARALNFLQRAYIVPAFFSFSSLSLSLSLSRKVGNYTYNRVSEKVAPCRASRGLPLLLWILQLAMRLTINDERNIL